MGVFNILTAIDFNGKCLERLAIFSLSNLCQVTVASKPRVHCSQAIIHALIMQGCPWQKRKSHSEVSWFDCGNWTSTMHSKELQNETTRQPPTTKSPPAAASCTRPCSSTTIGGIISGWIISCWWCCTTSWPIKQQPSKDTAHRKKHKI